MRRTTRTIMVLALSVLIAVPTAASAHITEGGPSDRASDVAHDRAGHHSDRDHDLALWARIRAMLERRAVDGLDAPGLDVARDRLAPGIVGPFPGQPRPEPTPIDPVPVDPRPVPHPCDLQPIRHDVFPVDEAGSVGLAWNSCGVRITGVRTAEGWRSETVEDGPRRVLVVFRDGHVILGFWAHLTEDGLDHGIRRAEEPPDSKHEVFPVGEAGAVALSWTREAITEVHVRTADGWRSEIVTRERTGVRVAFWNETTKLVFWAKLGEDGLRHGIERVHDDPPPPDTRHEVFPVGDFGAVALTWSREAILDVEAKSTDGWRHEVHRRSRTEVSVTFTDGHTKVLFWARLEDGELRHGVVRAVDEPQPRPTEPGPEPTYEPAPEPTRDSEPTDTKPTDATRDGTGG